MGGVQAKAWVGCVVYVWTGRWGCRGTCGALMMIFKLKRHFRGTSEDLLLLILLPFSPFRKAFDKFNLQTGASFCKSRRNPRSKLASAGSFCSMAKGRWHPT